MKKLMNMKWLIALVVMLSLTAINADAQRRGQYLTCTGDNVNVRTGPGKNYKVKTIPSFDVEMMRNVRMKLQLFRGNRVKYLGQRKNGFLFVQFAYEGEGGYITYYTGWVSADFLR